MLPNYILWAAKLFDTVGYFTGCTPSNFGKILRYSISLLLLIYFTTHNYNILLYVASIKIIEFVNAQLQYFSALFIYL